MLRNKMSRLTRRKIKWKNKKLQVRNLQFNQTNLIMTKKEKNKSNNYKINKKLLKKLLIKLKRIMS